MPETQKPRPRNPLQAMRLVPAPLGFAFFLILTLVLMAALLLVDRPLQTAAAPRGIVSFEFAGSVKRAGEIVQSWDGAPAPFAGFSLGLDYLYMVAYATTIAWACIWARRMVASRGWRAATLGVLLAWGLIAAAGLDALENVALLVLLLVRIAAPWPQVAWVAAALKFALILAGLAYSVLGVGAWLTARIRQVGLAR
jgi:hypothetical protein